ncbi:MAG TPA: 6-pyruvoyl tetrahydropterin synthase family protein [Planctomycetaceae bacterium]|nr:6-pyruvoyl tetrahydropterin synthase family protein [Planctomycetaceae bacterium]
MSPNETPLTFRVRVTKDHLVFSAAHFITFNGNVCERLHGHNWRMAVEVTGALDENGYVFDFIALRDAAQQLVSELDHRMLLPTGHPMIHVSADDAEVTVRFEGRRWVFPREDCVLLPVANTTAELIARWMAERLREKIRATSGHRVDGLSVDVEENFGQWARCDLPV